MPLSSTGHFSSTASEMRGAGIPVTDNQRGIWLVMQMAENLHGSFHESHSMRIKGSLDVDALEESLQTLVGRHESLRIVFDEDFACQRLAEDRSIRLGKFDFAAEFESKGEDGLADTIRAAQEAPFDLQKGPLVRARLYILGDQRYAFLLTIHHLVIDGHSWGILLGELESLYCAYTSNGEVALPPALPFSEYRAWLDLPEQVEERESCDRFWEGKLSKMQEPIEFRSDFPRLATREYRCERVSIDFGPERSALVESAKRELRCTAFQLLLASFAVWMRRQFDDGEPLVGVHVAGHAHLGLQEVEGADRLVGCLSELFPLSAPCDPDRSFDDYLFDVVEGVFALQENPRVSFDSFRNKAKRNARSRTMSDISAVFNMRYETRTRFADMEVRKETPSKTYSLFDLAIDIRKVDTRYEIDCSFASELFRQETIGRWMRQWLRVLDRCLDDPKVRIGDVSLLSEDEATLIAETWNDTKRDFPLARRVHELIDEQVVRTPSAVAFEFEGVSLSYRELDERSNRLARYLQARGIEAGDLVGISLERTLRMPVALLSILKAGGAYVSIDPRYPRERIRYVIEDSGVESILSESAVVEYLGDSLLGAVCIDRFEDEINAFESSPIEYSGSSRDLAYVIYTSGSTGNPKGVQIEHASLTNFVFSMLSVPGISGKDTLLAVTTLSFDIAALEMFLPLVCGARIVMASEETTVDGVALRSAIEEKGVSFLQATPGAWRMLLAAGWKGKSGFKALCGGEPLPRALVDPLLERCGELWNMYGPTETTIWSTCSRIESSDDINIGRPICNTEVYIVDSQGNLAPVGRPGELLIAGAGVARGYLNRDELTRERFIEHPFRNGARAYRTGDLAMYRENGVIDCLGRSDRQVKIRGYRIELGEVEKALAMTDRVDRAAVTTFASASGELAMAAYLVSSGGSGDVESVKASLVSRLPRYMVPSYFVFLERLPLTSNGKVDRMALPKPDFDRDSRAFDSPLGEREIAVAGLFGRSLKRSRVGRHDDFFELGGDSIVAIDFFRQLNESFGTTIGVATLFRASTVATLAKEIECNIASVSSSNFHSLVPIQKSGGRRPLFCVHGAGGNVLLYRDLCKRLGEEQPVYGLQSRGLVDAAARHETVAAMAESYVDEILSVQSDGPFRIGGYCMGGAIALEIGRLLEARGKDVAFIGLFDTYNVASVSFPNPLRSIGERIGFHLSNALRAPVSHWPMYLSRKLRSALDGELRLLLKDLGAGIGLRRAEAGGGRKGEDGSGIEHTNRRAALAHRPERFGGRVTVFKPARNYSHYSDPRLGWAEVVDGQLEVVELAMNPHAMLVEPFVEVFAEALVARLAPSN